MEESALSRFAVLLARLLRDPAGDRFGVRTDPATGRPMLHGAGQYVLRALERYATARALDLPVPFQSPYQLARGRHLLRLALSRAGVDLRMERRSGAGSFIYTVMLQPETERQLAPELVTTAQEDTLATAEVYTRKLHDALLRAIARGQAENALLLADRLLVELRLLVSH